MTRSTHCTPRALAICLLLAVVLGLAACVGSPTVQCPPRPTPGPAQEWPQAPGGVAMALPATVFGTDAYVQAAVFNHSTVTIELPPVYNNCAFFTAERLEKGTWHQFNACRRLDEAPAGGRGGNLVPGAFGTDELRVLLLPGTYRLKQSYAIYPANPENVANLKHVYSLSFQVCVCARCT